MVSEKKRIKVVRFFFINKFGSDIFSLEAISFLYDVADECSSKIGRCTEFYRVLERDEGKCGNRGLVPVSVSFFFRASI